MSKLSPNPLSLSTASNVVSIAGSGQGDPALVRAVQAGDTAAARVLYERHARWVHALVYRLAPTWEGTDDLVQDAFVAVFENIGKLQDVDRFKPWLRGIVVRMAAKRLRWHRLRYRLGLVRAGAFDIERAVSKSASPDTVVALRQIYRVVESLPAQQRIALLLKRVEGMNHEQIADALGVSVPTARRRLEAAQRCLAQLGEEVP